MRGAAVDSDLIIVRDLPLAPLALVVARARGIPVVLDMAECYPEMLRARWKFGGATPVDALVRNPWLADILERATTRRVDHTLVMVEESRDRLLALGVSGDRVTIVSNTPVLSRLNATSLTICHRDPDHIALIRLFHATFQNLAVTTKGFKVNISI